MKQLRNVIFVLLFLLAVQMAYANNVGLAVQRSLFLDSTHELPIKNLLENMGYTVTLIDKDNVGSVDFNNLGLIVVSGPTEGSEYLAYTKTLPVNSYSTIAIYPQYLKDWGWVSSTGFSVETLSYATYMLGSYNDQGFNIVNSLSPSSVLIDPAHNLVGVITSSTSMKSLANLQTYPGDGFILAAEKGTSLSSGATNNGRIVFFGIPYPANWTPNTQTAFKNAVTWAISTATTTTTTTTITTSTVTGSSTTTTIRITDTIPPVVQLISPSDGQKVITNDSFVFIDFYFSVTDDKAAKLQCTFYTNKTNPFGNPNGDFIAEGMSVQVNNGDTGSLFPSPFTQNEKIKWNVGCSDGVNFAFAPANWVLQAKVGVTSCTTNADCNDGLFCNGAEVCGEDSVCHDGTPFDCSSANLAAIGTCGYTPDANPLTWDSATAVAGICDEQTKSCVSGTYQVTSSCDKAKCGAQCDSQNSCAATKCQDICVGGKLYNCSNVANTCTAGCTCTRNACTTDVSQCTHTGTDLNNDSIDDVCAEKHIIGSSANVTTNIQGLVFNVNGVPNPANARGEQLVTFTAGNNIILEFTYDFTNETVLNLNNVEITTDQDSEFGSILIRGLDLTGQSSTKTVYINHRFPETLPLCIIDAEVTTLDYTGDCEDGVRLECPGTGSGYSCTVVDNGARYKITGLKHSMVTEYNYVPPTDNSYSGGGGGGGGSFRTTTTAAATTTTAAAATTTLKPTTTTKAPATTTTEAPTTTEQATTTTLAGTQESAAGTQGKIILGVAIVIAVAALGTLLIIKGRKRAKKAPSKKAEKKTDDANEG